MDNQKICLLCNDEIIKTGDTIRVTFDNNEIREGELQNMYCNNGYCNSFSINIKDKDLDCGCYNLGVDMESILKIEKIK